MSYPRYPKYTETNIEWIGQIPAHWKINRLKMSIRSCRNGVWGDEAKGDEYDVPCIRVADFDRTRRKVKLNDPTVRNISAKDREGRLVQRGDLLLEKSGGGETQPVGCVVMYDDDPAVVCSNFIARMEMADGMDNSYWRYAHAAAYDIRLTTASINQTSGIQNLDQWRYFEEKFPFPPLPEQRELAVFLDRETARIDFLIAEQERLIQLLNEKRQALISHAVTKGLNPDVPMKDSGVEWLGNVPKHWEVKALRTIASVVRGASPRPAGDPAFFASEGTPWVTVAEITKDQNEDLVETQEFLTDDGVSQSRIFETGTVIYSNSGATLGVPKVLRVRACANDGVIGFQSLSATVDPIFLYYFLFSLTQDIRERVKQGSGQPNLNTDIVKAIRLALPPLSEQRNIVAELRLELGKMQTLQNLVAKALTLLHERRSAIISAAVTGKIDIRGVARDDSKKVAA